MNDVELGEISADKDNKEIDTHMTRCTKDPKHDRNLTMRNDRIAGHVISRAVRTHICI